MKTYEKGYSLDGTDNYHIDLKEKILTNGGKGNLGLIQVVMMNKKEKTSTNSI
jgi:hypothetical protein